jgi:hypothetical protein
VSLFFLASRLARSSAVLTESLRVPTDYDALCLTDLRTGQLQRIDATGHRSDYR